MYENLRSQFVSRLADHFDVFQLNYIMDQLDAVAFDFDIIPKERGLIVYEDGVPQVLKTFIACKKIEGLSDATLKNYWWVLSSFFQFCKAPIDKISSNDVRVFLATYQKMRNLSNRSLDAYRSYLSTFYAWACDEGYIEKNIMSKIKPIKYAEKQREALTQLELEVLRNTCETPRDRALVEFMYSTGCRVSELTNVKLEDIDFNSKTVLLFGKGSKYRTSYLNDKSIYYLKEYLKLRKGDSNYVFVGERAPYNPLKKDGVEKRFRELSTKANLGKEITPHVLRHTTATVGLQNGMPVTDIQRMLGHASLDTTMIYAEVSQIEVQNNHRKYVI